MKRTCVFALCLFIAVSIGLSIPSAGQYDPIVYKAQKALKARGYNPGKPDGLWGKSTERSVKYFQVDNELPVTGKLDEQTKAKLSIVSTARSVKRKKPIKERRIALVIGNSNYNSSPLRNPVNDANAIADIFREGGFEVTTGSNLSQSGMKRAINLFGNRISKGSVALFYYSGHGMQVNGTNYLIPVGAKIHHEDDVDVESVNVNRILAKMSSVENTTNILILDACRDNPFSRGFRTKQNGLAYMNAPTGTIIAYSTAPSSIASDGVGQYGIYTEELINHLLLPDLKIEDIFKRVRVKVAYRSKNKQIPWESSSLMGDFYFSIKRNVPTSSSFSIDDLTIEADEAEQIRKSWVQYDNDMKSAFQEVQRFLERDVAKEKKITALTRFLKAFDQNNPYSQEDNNIRKNAKKQIEYWNNYKQAITQKKDILAGMSIKEVRSILGKEQSFDRCGSNKYLYYNDRWIWAPSGIVKGYIPISSWTSPCASGTYARIYKKF